MIRNTISAHRRNDWRRRLGDVSPCGERPPASSFAAQPYTPLTPEENKRYLDAVSVWQQCNGRFQQTPSCPMGSSWVGGDSGGGTWFGQCVSTYTGNPVTDIASTPKAGFAQPQASPAPAPAIASYVPREAPPKVIPASPTFSPMPAPQGIPMPAQIEAPAAGWFPASFADVPTWAKYAAAGAALIFLMGGKR